MEFRGDNLKQIVTLARRWMPVVVLAAVAETSASRLGPVVRGGAGSAGSRSSGAGRAGLGAGWRWSEIVFYSL